MGGKGKNKEEREAAKKEKQKQKLKKQEERMKKREEKKKKKGGNRESRSGSNKKKKKNHNKNKKPSHVGKSKNKNQNTKKGRKHNKKQTVNKKRSDLKVQDKMLGSLSGIATLRRQGDVSVTDEDNHKIVMSEFQVGPLQLEVSRVYGNGKGRTVKSAKAITDIMTGVMTLKVKPDGTAHVKKVVFKPPENVDVEGSLSDD